MKFLHTADWQIGMKCLAAGDRASDARAERIRTIDRIADAANAHAVEFVVIAGDLFDSAMPKPSDVAHVVAALQRFAMPVYVLPGNHDPAGHQGPYGSPAWNVLQRSHVVTISEPGYAAVDGGELLFAPCAAKYGTQDPTLWFGERESPRGSIRIGLAHGCLQLGDIGRTHAGDTRGHFPISPKAASRGRLDYLALGDWHSYFRIADGSATIAYSGAPEATAFGEPDSGTVSIVTIDAAGAAPKIERVPVGRLRWVQREWEVSDDTSIAMLDRELMSLERPADALVRLTVRGLCTPSAAQQLRGLESVFAARFMRFEMQHVYVARPATREAWLGLVPPGEMRQLVTQLLDRIERDEDAAVASRALDKLAELSR